MAFGIDDVALSAMNEGAKEAMEESCQEVESGVEVAGAVQNLVVHLRTGCITKTIKRSFKREE